MQQFSVLLACFILALLPPILGRQTASNAEYYLQTSVTNGAGDCGTNKGGLYVADYHTGAGFTDAVLSADISIASKGFLNGTYQQFDYNTSFPWYMDFEDITYANWIPVQINAAELPTAGFKISGGQLLVSTHVNFGGWVACDWWHGMPQLFSLLVFDEGPNPVIPASCSMVELQVIPT